MWVLHSLVYLHLMNKMNGNKKIKKLSLLQYYTIYKFKVGIFRNSL
jgi:hypothetical protein